MVKTLNQHSTLENVADISSYDTMTNNARGAKRSVNFVNIDDIKEIGIDAVDIGVGTESPSRPDVTEATSPSFPDRSPDKP